VSRCYPPDNGNPRVAGFSISPQVVDARRGPQVVTFRVRPRDTGGPGAATGVLKGRLSYGLSPSASFGSARMHWNGHGALVFRLEFSPHDVTGDWFVGVALWDAAGNQVDYLPRDLTAAGFPASVSVVTGAAPDEEKPKLRSVVLGSDVVSAAAHRGVLRLRVRARDDVAVWAVHAFVWSERLRDSRDGNLRRISGTVKNGVWTGRIVVPRTAGTNRAHLVVEVGDYRGRWRTYRTRALREIGAATSVRVVGHVDEHRPQVRKPRIRPVGPVDLRTGTQKFVIRVRITDVGAGVSGRPSFTFEGSATNMDHQGYDLDMRLVSGTRRDGIWQAKVSLPRCEGEAGPWSGYVTAFDFGLPGDQASTDNVKVLNDDIAPPLAEHIGRVRPEGPVSIRFDEDVVGVTTDNVLVFQGFPDAADRPTQPAPILGSWACQDAVGAPVDCSTGPVRTARFTPSSPFVDLEDTSHTMILNPEGHLGLTDLVGNPVVNLFNNIVFLGNDIVF
jgi:hypothetical protein